MSDEAITRSLMNFNYRDGAAITPDDLGTHNYDAISATTPGKIKVDMVGGSTAVLLPINVVTPYRYKITRVYATGTTALGLVGLNARS